MEEEVEIPSKQDTYNLEYEQRKFSIGKMMLCSLVLMFGFLMKSDVSSFPAI